MTTGETYPATPHGRAYIPNIPAQTFAAHADTRLILCPGWRLQHPARSRREWPPMRNSVRAQLASGASGVVYIADPCYNYHCRN